MLDLVGSFPSSAAAAEEMVSPLCSSSEARAKSEAGEEGAEEDEETEDMDEEGEEEEGEEEGEDEEEEEAVPLPAVEVAWGAADAATLAVVVLAAGSTDLDCCC
mmetsp:Transcript_4023/g.9542  ORF Transcript_4023/g.9542 Transcript_4023/m.9542 type:complete len:104 (-) Transcript_4023:462-773(-)